MVSKLLKYTRCSVNGHSFLFFKYKKMGPKVETKETGLSLWVCGYRPSKGTSLFLKNSNTYYQSEKSQ